MDREKFKTLIQYVCTQSPSLLSLGATKLNKILWFAERDCYLRGEPISLVPFIKLPRGPVPQSMDEYLGELQSEGRLLVRDTEYRGKPKREFIPLKEVSLEGFTPGQVSIIDKATQTICRSHTAESISKISHDEVWDLAKIGGVIPLYATYGRRGQLSEEDITWAHQQLKEISAVA
jgi:hypothetical protein